MSEMQISHVLVFQGEVPEVVLCPSLEEAKRRIYEAFLFQPEDIESFDRNLDSDDSWTFDEAGDRFCFSTGIGEIETVIIYTVKQQPSAA